MDDSNQKAPLDDLRDTVDEGVKGTSQEMRELRRKVAEMMEAPNADEEAYAATEQAPPRRPLSLREKRARKAARKRARKAKRRNR